LLRLKGRDGSPHAVALTAHGVEFRVGHGGGHRGGRGGVGREGAVKRRLQPRDAPVVGGNAHRHLAGLGAARLEGGVEHPESEHRFEDALALRVGRRREARPIAGEKDVRAYPTVEGARALA